MTANNANRTDTRARVENELHRLAPQQRRQGPGTISKTYRAKKKLPLPQALAFCRKFIRVDATQYFLRTWEPTLVAWASLVHISRIPADEPLTAQRVAEAVRVIDGVIGGEYNPELPPRFGFVQLFNFLESLKSRIEADKRRGLIAAESCRINATRAYELYRNAQKISTSIDRLRRFRQIGSRWRGAIRSSTLLLIVFSETAESFA